MHGVEVHRPATAVLRSIEGGRRRGITSCLGRKRPNGSDAGPRWRQGCCLLRKVENGLSQFASWSKRSTGPLQFWKKEEIGSAWLGREMLWDWKNRGGKLHRGIWFLNLNQEFWFKEKEFKSKVLNISKPNLKGIHNRINSNKLFGEFSHLVIWKLI
jgi:hypothetical protein